MIRVSALALSLVLLAACAQVQVVRAPGATAVAGEQIDRAEQALRDGEAATALALLGSEQAAVDARERERWGRLRAEALATEGEYFEAARQLALLDASLTRQAQADNRAEIDRLLARVPDGELSANAAMLPDGHVMYPFAGRALSSRGLPLPRAYDRHDFPGEALALRPPADHDGYRPPMRLAVLLPMSGQMETASRSVRDGILAAHYREQRRRPEVVFYDTAGSAAGSVDAYQLATSEGADQILGPLSRDEVSALFRQDGLNVPVLALNRASEPGPPGSASFALNPEEEGLAAAERLLQRGLNRIITVTGTDDSARRALDAFKVRFQERGGVILAEARIDDSSPDYSRALQLAQQQAGGPDVHDALFLALRAPTRGCWCRNWRWPATRRARSRRRRRSSSAPATRARTASWTASSSPRHRGRWAASRSCPMSTRSAATWRAPAAVVPACSPSASTPIGCRATWNTFRDPPVPGSTAPPASCASTASATCCAAPAGACSPAAARGRRWMAS
nr:penicillin-binding protein activator [Alkalisalibacterium limincola]